MSTATTPPKASKPKVQPLAYPERECPTYAGISQRLWEKLLIDQAQILKPCIRTTSGRCYYLAKDIEAALIANKSAQ